LSQLLSKVTVALFNVSALQLDDALLTWKSANIWRS